MTNDAGKGMDALGNTSSAETCFHFMIHKDCPSCVLVLTFVKATAQVEVIS